MNNGQGLQNQHQGNPISRATIKAKEKVVRDSTDQGVDKENFRRISGLCIQ